jgi:hypothetical protein
LAAASGGMHGYLQGRDAIEQASVSKRQSRLRLRLRRPGAYRWPGTPHGLKAEPQGAGSANVYSLDGANLQTAPAVERSSHRCTSAEGRKRWRSSSSCACSQR